MASQTKEPPLDEIQWRSPLAAQQMQGIHSNSVLFYFAQSPFFDPTSNNAVIASQAMFNPAMLYLVQTREAFEGRLREMAGLEFVVAQEPAETAPGTGTGVWVISKQMRRKTDAEDDVTVYSTYYIVGENIYMAPTLAQLLSFRMSTISSSLAKCFPSADEARIWHPSRGHTYRLPPATNNPRPRATTGSKDATPMPDAPGTAPKNDNSLELKKAESQSAVDARLAEQSLLVHMQYGGDYMDENPITGQPGSFHLSSTGRKDKFQLSGLSALNTSAKSPATGSKKTGNKSGEKTPKTPQSSTSKLKRKKSKSGQTPTAS
ncbi:MED6-domain-containing protein [Xylariaceae sp. FL1019]|nr:MED6-domain-containing protein [Xylariaceae sp. FL1019]